MLSRTKIHAQNKPDKTFLSDLFLSDMIPMSYLRQNRKVSRDFRDKRVKSKESRKQFDWAVSVQETGR